MLKGARAMNRVVVLPRIEPQRAGRDPWCLDQRAAGRAARLGETSPRHGSRARKFVDFIQKNDALFSTALIDFQHRWSCPKLCDLVDEKFVGIRNREPARFGRPPKLPKIVADRDGAQLRARACRDSRHGMPPEDCVSTSIVLVIELPGEQLLAEGIAGRGAGIGADQRRARGLQRQMGKGLHVFAPGLAGLRIATRRMRTICSTSRPT